MNKLDYKKTYKDLYQPKAKPSIIDVPEMLFITVDGDGDPNTCQGYKDALEILYGLSFTIKMSKMNNSTKPEGYFEYVVPPLEGLWYADGVEFDGMNIIDKSKFKWISMIRQPEFVNGEIFETAKTLLKKKKEYLDLQKAKLVKITEGLCVQIMHNGAYDDEPASIEAMNRFVVENGYVLDFSEKRLHHEIYLSDPRRCRPEKMKTVIRHPVRKNIDI